MSSDMEAKMPFSFIVAEVSCAREFPPFIASKYSSTFSFLACVFANWSVSVCFSASATVV